ncbi:MAG: thiopurine S-methyltransferase [Deltaproteobacteria bacterium]|nr:thiopurine S-methyltransferase [Deltaproteobacteria bacterium]
MQSEFWHERWAQRQIGFHQNEVHPLLQVLWSRLRPQPAEGAFVPLCGKTLDMHWLRAQGHPVVGVELSPVAVGEFFAEANLDPTQRPLGELICSEAQGLQVYCGDFFALQPGDVAHCRLIYDRGALIALPPAMRRDYARHLRHLFGGGARILLVALDYPQHETNGPPFAVTAAEVGELYACGHMTELSRQDILADSPNLAQRGVTRLEQVIYLIELGPRDETL